MGRIGSSAIGGPPRCTTKLIWQKIMILDLVVRDAQGGGTHAGLPSAHDADGSARSQVLRDTQDA